MSKKQVKTTEESKFPYEDMFQPQETLDFHTFGPLLHFQIEDMIKQFIEESYNRSLSNIKIITGKGNIVRPMALKLLKKSKYVQEYRFAGYFTGQTGAIEIILKN